MTAPDAPGSNDEVIRVIYEAVADYSQLMRETRRAREETRQLKREFDSLGGTTTQRVKVEADTGQARSELARVFKDIAVKIKVTVDAFAANAELQRLLREIVIKARVVVDAAAVRTAIARIRDVVVTVKAKLDDASMAALSSRLSRIRDAVVNVKLVVEDAQIERLRARLARLRDVTVRVAASVDDAAVERIRRRLATIRAKIEIKLDRSGVIEQFKALLAHLESLGPVVIAVEIRQDAIDRMEAAADRLERIRDRVQAGGGGPGDGDAGGGAAAGIPRGLSRAALYVAALGPLITALIPLAAGLTGAVGTMAGSFLAAGAATAIFAVAAVGAFHDVSEAVEQYEKYGQVAAGPLGDVVAAFEALKARYKEFQAATQGDVFAVFTRGLDIAASLLDKIQDLVGEVAGGIDDALAEVQAGISGQGFDEFLDFVGAEGPHAIKQFTAGLLDIGGGIAKLLMQFQPFIRGFVDGFAAMAEKFNAWASDLDNNDKFQAFLDYCMANVPRLIDFFVAFVEAAANLLVGLAPIGDAFLSLTTAALEFIAALPPGVLTGIAGAIMLVATALVAAKVAAMASNAWSGLLGMFEKLRGGAGGLAGALKGVGIAMAATAAIAAYIGFLNDLQRAQENAAKATKLHYDRVTELNNLVNDNGGDPDAPEVREDQLNRIMGLSAEGVGGGAWKSAANGFGTVNGRDNWLADQLPAGGWGSNKVNVGFGQVAEEAGISQKELVDASLGKDPKQQAENIGKLEAYRRKIAQQAKDTGDDDLAAKADAIGQLIDQYEALSFESGKVKEGADGAADAIGKTGDNAKDAAGKILTAADAAGAVEKALRADFGGGEVMGRYDAMTGALEAYEAQKRAVADATDAEAAADRRAKRAAEDVNTARAAAVQRIKDVQRALRDLALDERQANLNAKQAKERLDELLANGGDEDAIEQAKIDLERAQNAKEDFKQDKKGKKSALEEELARGVEGNRALQDAIQNNLDAQKALTEAHRNLGEAAVKLNDLHLAFLTASGAMGLSEKEAKKLKERIDGMKDKQLKIIVDTKDAEKALARLLQTQIATQLIAGGMSPEEAWAEAGKRVPTAAAAPKTSTSKTGRERLDESGHRVGYRAEGGPALVSTGATAGALYGPGTGTSDSIHVRLPVGGDLAVSRGEHIVTDAEVRAAPGGHAYLEAFRAGLRAGKPWAPWPGYAKGGQAKAAVGVPARAGWSAVLPAFRAPVSAATVAALPAFASGGSVAGAARQIDARVDRSRTASVHIGTINNPVPEPASVSAFRAVRDAVEGDEY